MRSWEYKGQNNYWIIRCLRILPMTIEDEGFFFLQVNVIFHPLYFKMEKY